MSFIFATRFDLLCHRWFVFNFKILLSLNANQLMNRFYMYYKFNNNAFSLSEHKDSVEQYIVLLFNCYFVI